MNESFPTESSIRQYLLGRLNDQEELDTSLSVQICFNDELAEIVGVIEDEIIEQYLDETLKAEDKRAFENYFLRPSERKEKLTCMRALRSVVKTYPTENEAKVVNVSHPDLRVMQGAGVGVIAHFRSHNRTYLELAATILVVISTTYLIRTLQDMRLQAAMAKKAEAQLQLALAQERQHSADQAQELAQLEPPIQLSFGGSLVRDRAKIPKIEIRRFTQSIKVEIGHSSAPTYDVHVENDAKTAIWSETGLTPSSRILRFEIPAQGITAGDYTIVATPKPTGKEESYRFRAKVTSRIQVPPQK